jgi:hypothetical protein
MYAPTDEMTPQEDVLRGHLAMEAEEPAPEHHDPLSALENEQAQDAVRLYLREIGRVPLLKKADEVRLAKAIELQRLIENAGRRVLLDHWAGDRSELSDLNLQRVFSAAAFFLPIGIQRKLRRIARRSRPRSAGEE